MEIRTFCQPGLVPWAPWNSFSLAGASISPVWRARLCAGLCQPTPVPPHPVPSPLRQLGGPGLEVGPGSPWRPGPLLPEEGLLLPIGPQISCPAFQTPQLQPRGAMASDLLYIPTCLGSNRKVGVCLCTDGLAGGGPAKEHHFNR